MLEWFVLLIGTVLLIYFAVVLARVIGWNITGGRSDLPDSGSSVNEFDGEWPVIAEDHLDQKLTLMAEHLENQGIPTRVEAENPTITQGAAYLLRSKLRVPPEWVARARAELGKIDFNNGR